MVSDSLRHFVSLNLLHNKLLTLRVGFSAHSSVEPTDPVNDHIVVDQNIGADVIVTQKIVPLGEVVCPGLDVQVLVGQLLCCPGVATNSIFSVTFL